MYLALQSIVLHCGLMNHCFYIKKLFSIFFYMASEHVHSVNNFKYGDVSIILQIVYVLVSSIRSVCVFVCKFDFELYWVCVCVCVSV